VNRLLFALAVSTLLTSVRADDPKPADPEQAVVDALAGDKGFGKGEYKYVRGVFARYFEQKFAAEIKAGLGDKYSEIMKWLAENPDVKETLFTAIDPEFDDVEKALAVFAELYGTGPEKVKTHASAAIACAVVWDNPAAVYDYRPHQVRTKSILPGGVMTNRAKENFLYLVDHETQLKGQVQLLPWEFLVHVVNHYTPTDEREWAIDKYLKRRVGIGTSYKDIVYDKEMLRTKSELCRLNGKPYTLAGIKDYGGVCAMQADFACRVAKSLGVPAEYVGGEANFGGLHAWVMWVELKSVTKEKIDFALISEGRYFTDQYYVGHLKDPRTGKMTTDRAMELRLATVGAAPQNGRQADLLMRFYPVVKERKNLNARGQAAYLGKVLELFPHADRAWRDLAALYKERKQTEPSEALKYANKAFTTFLNYPDLSWELFDDLLTPVKEKSTRAEQFNRLVLRYEALNRPDLACEARIKFAEYQAEAKEYKKAADGLAQTIRKFPTEGRYVPKMMEKLQDVCTAYGKNGTELLAKFYVQILPQIPPKRGDEVSEYCVKMYQQAVDFFKKNGKAKEADVLELQMNRIKQGRG
jgi:hypothetical protein